MALGGDGLMLQTLHTFMNTGKPIYGMNCGSVGFLMNEFREDDLPARLAAAVETAIHPLAMRAIDADGVTHTAFAINEVSLLRQSYQAAKLEIAIDGHVRLEELICDGILVATPAGSTAYNLSAHGPILPIYAPLLALTPISAFRPRTWRGALLPDHVEVRITILEAEKRPVNAVADNVEFKSVVEVTVAEDKQTRKPDPLRPGSLLGRTHPHRTVPLLGRSLSRKRDNRMRSHRERHLTKVAVHGCVAVGG